MVPALNMMDEVRGNGGQVRINEMEELLGIPVAPISAAKNEGVDELVRHSIHVAQYQERPGRTDFCSQDELAAHGGALYPAVGKLLFYEIGMHQAADAADGKFCIFAHLVAEF